mmetsp:Transcript_579/g.1149  ORF Transcript_579/g.1149 Transcript_579/m.1149 type:complete len:84 (-) Transcript_579:351-602(-)
MIRSTGPPQTMTTVLKHSLPTHLTWLPLVRIHERRITHEEIDLAMSKLDDLILQILPGCEPTTMQRGPGTRAMPLTKSNDANQ